MNPKKTDRKPLLFIMPILIVLLAIAWKSTANLRNEVLVTAAGSGDVATAKVGLEIGADPNKALLAAVANDQPKLVELLISKGADVNKKDADGGCALTSAIIFRKYDITPILFKHGANVNTIFPGGATAFAWTASAGDTESLAMLAANGADVNTRFDGGFNALMLAGERGDTDLADILIKHGEDVNEKCPFGSPLLEAVDNGHAEMVDFLLSHGANVNAPVPESPSANSVGSALGQVSILPAAQSTPAPKTTGASPTTAPLIRAAAGGYADIAEALISHGADINAKDSKGRTALSFAKAGKSEVLIQLLEKSGAKE